MSEEGDRNSNLVITMLIVGMLFIVVIAFILGYRIGFADGVAYIKPILSATIPMPTPI